MIFYLYIFLVVLVGVLVLISASHVWSFKNIFQQDKRLKRKTTMFDVRHLLMEGQKDLAIQMYCEIFHTTTAKAKKDIEELERSLKV